MNDPAPAKKGTSGELERLRQRNRELEELFARNAETEAVLRENVEIVYNLTHGLAATTGLPFFKALLSHLAKNLQADYALVGELCPTSSNQVQTVAAWANDKLSDNFTYFLDGTPCQQVFDHGVCIYPSGVQSEFPQDTLLAEMDVEGYVGSPLLGSDGIPFGILVVMKRKPFERPDLALTLLKIFASRASAELDRLHNQQRLIDSEKRFRSFFESAAAGMFILSADAKVLQSNCAAAALLQISQHELAGRTVESLTHPLDRQKTLDFYRSLTSRTAQTFDYEKRYLRRDGSVIWGLTTVTPIFSADGSVNYYLALVQDITARRKAEDILRQSEQMKTEFISTAAHELQTPLTIIMGYSELLLAEDGPCPLSNPQQVEFATEIYQKSEKLSEIVDDLLDLSRMDTGQMISVKKTLCNFDQIVTEVVSTYQKTGSRHPFDTALAGPPGSTLRLDRNKMAQVVNNLISNAVKYSPQGTAITIRGEAVSDTYRLTIRDRGVGMTPGQLQRVFQKFYRADASDTAVQGLGLGLSIARHIVERHEGQIEIDSSHGEGTTVTLVLPRPPQ